MDDFNKTSNIYPNLSTVLSNEQQFRLMKINEIKDYFLAEIISKNLSKFIASLDYFDKSLNILSILLGSIASFLLNHFQVLLEHVQEQLGQVAVLHFQLLQD